MSKSIFEFSDYKRYLLDRERALGSEGHGFRTRMAKALGCHSAYVSQVLNKSAHFSPEQAEALNQFLGHGLPEANFLLLLVQRARAGTNELRERLDQQMRESVERHLTLKNRVDIQEILSEEYQSRYYGSWLYAAVHILVTIPEFRTFASIQKRMGLSTEKLTEILDFLVKTNLIVEGTSGFEPGLARIFLNRESELYARHHVNWRIKAADVLERGTSGLHYSAAVSLAKEDVARIREALIQGIENARKIIKDSKEEELYAMTLDFFRI